jgi:hypothetical protein
MMFNFCLTNLKHIYNEDMFLHKNVAKLYSLFSIIDKKSAAISQLIQTIKSTIVIYCNIFLLIFDHIQQSLQPQ